LKGSQDYPSTGVGGDKGVELYKGDMKA